MKVETRFNEKTKSTEIKLYDGLWYDTVFDKRIVGFGLGLTIKKPPVKPLLVMTEDTRDSLPIDRTFMYVGKTGEVKYFYSMVTIDHLPNHTIYEIHPLPIFYEDIDVFCEKYNLEECRYRGVLVTKGSGLLPNSNRYLSLKRLKKTPEPLNTFLCTNGIPYTFGVEFETSTGTVPPWVLDYYDIGISCERDGSVSGGEYITNVLQGDEGFLELYKICKVLSERCNTNSSCGLHVHIGGALFNKNFIVLAYLFAIKIQDDLFLYFPESRRNNEMCSKLHSFSKVEDLIKRYGFHEGSKLAFEFLFEHFSNGRSISGEVNKCKPHPGGRYTDRYQRGIELKNLFRYKWFNLIPSTFDTRGFGKEKANKHNINNGIPHTLEFRNHHATLDFISSSYWVMICMAMTNFIENNMKSILECKKLYLKEVISATYNGSKARNICSYLESQKNLYSLEGVENIEPLLPIDYRKDHQKGDVIKMLS